MEADLSKLIDALEKSKGKTPGQVVRAFCPNGNIVAGHKLAPVTAGHDLLFTQLDHPIHRHGAEWSAHDVAVAFYVLTRNSKDLFAQIENDTFTEGLYAFLETIPLAESNVIAGAIMAHWIAAHETSVSLKSPIAGSKKKTPLVDGLTWFQRLAKRIVGASTT